MAQTVFTIDLTVKCTDWCKANFDADRADDTLKEMLMNVSKDELIKHEEAFRRIAIEALPEKDREIRKVFYYPTAGLTEEEREDRKTNNRRINQKIRRVVKKFYAMVKKLAGPVTQPLPPATPTVTPIEPASPATTVSSLTTSAQTAQASSTVSSRKKRSRPTSSVVIADADDSLLTDYLDDSQKTFVRWMINQFPCTDVNVFWKPTSGLQIALNKHLIDFSIKVEAPTATDGGVIWMPPDSDMKHYWAMVEKGFDKIVIAGGKNSPLYLIANVPNFTRKQPRIMDLEKKEVVEEPVQEESDKGVELFNDEAEEDDDEAEEDKSSDEKESSEEESSDDEVNTSTELMKKMKADIEKKKVVTRTNSLNKRSQ
jgi:hypothetical protein